MIFICKLHMWPSKKKVWGLALMCLRGQYLSAGRAAKAAVAAMQHTQSPLPCFSNVLECLHNYNSRVILIKVSLNSPWNLADWSGHCVNPQQKKVERQHKARWGTKYKKSYTKWLPVLKYQSPPGMHQIWISVIWHPIMQPKTRSNRKYFLPKYMFNCLSASLVPAMR
jgi:hypothetical protein